MVSPGESGWAFLPTDVARPSRGLPDLFAAALDRFAVRFADFLPPGLLAGRSRVAFAVGFRDLTFFMTRSSLWLQLLRLFGVNSVSLI
jgi:hypothetical protein